MPLSVTHSFVSAIADGGDTSLVEPSNWNATHSISGTIGVANGGTGTGTAFTAGSVLFAGTSGVYTEDNSNFFWDDTNNVLTLGGDANLQRDASNTLAQRNGTTAQTARIYNTYSSSGTNYERAKIGWNSNVLEIGSESGGAGVARNIKLLQNGASVFSTTDTLNNTLIGKGSGNFTMTGGSNTVCGISSLAAVTSGNNNVALGLSTLPALTEATNNMAIGTGAMFRITTGGSNVAIGTHAMFTSVSSGANVAIGKEALEAEDGTGYNTAIGFCAGNQITNGNTNVVIGANTTTTYGPTTGDSNILIGTGADIANPAADNQLCIGNLIYGTSLDAGGATISSGNIGIGVKAPGERLEVVGNIMASSVRGTAVTFANRPGTPVKGMLVTFTDSTTAVWGATITGTGANNVLGFYNGTNWTVAGI